MSVTRKLVYAAIGALFVAGVVIGCALLALHHLLRDPPDQVLIAQLLRIDELPSGTKIVCIRKDLLPDTVVDAQLTVSHGGVERLIAGLPFKEIADPTDAASRTRRWELHYNNADFSVSCDATGTNVYVSCAID
jgi:hypothetical protein